MRFTFSIHIAFFVCFFVSPLEARLLKEYEPIIIQLKTKDEIGELCSKKIVKLILENNQKYQKTVLGLATGSTPIPLYRALKKAIKAHNINLSKVVTFNLDEYVGLPKSHPQSYHTFMHTELFSDLLASKLFTIGIRLENIHIPEASNKNSAEAYERKIQEEGPIDLQILGVGTNGHIGFNEPGSSFEGRTSIVKLTDNTIKDNARFFENDSSQVPKQAISMGIGTILKQSKEIMLIATGKSKSAIIKEIIEGKTTEKVPATALRYHPKVTIFLDSEAASEL